MILRLTTRLAARFGYVLIPAETYTHLLATIVYPRGGMWLYLVAALRQLPNHELQVAYSDVDVAETAEIKTDYSPEVGAVSRLRLVKP